MKFGFVRELFSPLTSKTSKLKLIKATFPLSDTPLFTTFTKKMAKRKAVNEAAGDGAAIVEDNESDEVSSPVSHYLTMLNVLGGI